MQNIITGISEINIKGCQEIILSIVNVTPRQVLQRIYP